MNILHKLEPVDDFEVPAPVCLDFPEMGTMASRKLKDLKRGGAPFIIPSVVMPIPFATMGICIVHIICMLIKQELNLGTYVLLSVLLDVASYIALPAIQRLAIPEASSRLPLAASLGLSFAFTETIGIPMDIEIGRTSWTGFPPTDRRLVRPPDQKGRRSGGPGPCLEITSPGGKTWCPSRAGTTGPAFDIVASKVRENGQTNYL